MIKLDGVIKDVKKVEYTSKENLAKVRYELLVDVGYNYPVKLRLSILPAEYQIGKKIDLNVFSNAWSSVDKRYIPVSYYPTEK